MSISRSRSPLARSNPFEGILAQARRQVRLGHYAQAGAILAELAREAEALSWPGTAAELHCRAAHCLLEGGAKAAGVSEARSALRVLRNQGSSERFARFLGNVLRKLQARGLTGEVGTIRTEFDGLAAVRPEPSKPSSYPRLPSACPQCGGPLRGDEVEWVDERSAECNYCGEVVQGIEQ